MYKRASDGRWAEAVKLKSGKTKVIYGKTKNELKKKLIQFSEEAEEKATFSKVADAWEAYHKDSVTYNAHDTVYPAPLRRAKAYFGDTSLNSITPFEIDAFIKYIAKQGFAKRTVQVHLNMLNMIFDYAIISEDYNVSYNPCPAVKIPKGLKKTRRMPPTDEQIAVITPDTASEMGLFAFFLLYTGLRRGELLGLRWEDIDRKSKTIHVGREVYYVSNNPHIKVPKTDAGVRDVVLLDILEAALPANKSGYIFGGDKPLTKSAFRKRWISFCREIGLAERIEHTHIAQNGREYTAVEWKPMITPHQFRHACASLLDDAGINETGAKAILGHSSIVVTKDIYTHIRSKKQRAINEQINTYINSEKNSEES